MWSGKLVGVLIGAMTGNPVLMLLGLFIGHLYDKGMFKAWFHRERIGTEAPFVSSQSIFFTTTFQVLGHIAKADGRVSETELDVVRHVMHRMGLNKPMQMEAIRLFQEGKALGFDLLSALAQLREACYSQPLLLQVFLEIQNQMVEADGGSTRKREEMATIVRTLGVPFGSFYSWDAGFGGNANDQRGYSQGGQQRSSSSYKDWALTEAYRVLGVSEMTSDADIKKAYRRLMSQHHPDKVASKGLSPEMQKRATEKAQEIQAAYDRVKEARGIR